LSRKYSKRDIYINLLPREYLPEPEFKLFWVIAIVFIAVLGWYLYMQWTDLDEQLKDKEAENAEIVKGNDEKIPQIVPVPVIQANSRLILSYLYNLPGIIELGPDWLNVYIELENQIPSGMWVERMSFVGGNERGIWPGISIVCVSTAPQAIEKVLDFGQDLENSNQFIGTTLRYWQWIDLPEGHRGVTFQIDMGIER
jgi:hypothetical protein